MKVKSWLKLLTFAFLTSVPLFGFAGMREFGDWAVVETNDGDVVAGTFADGAEKGFAIRCSAKDQTCFHLVRLGGTCEEGSQYPILINAPSGAVSVTGLCTINQAGTAELFLTPFDKVRGSLADSGMIGFAVPMASGAFVAVRFSLRGSAKAIEIMEELAAKRAPGTSSSGSKRRGASTF